MRWYFLPQMNYLPIEGTNQNRDSMVQEARFSTDYMLIFGMFVFNSKETANLLVQRQDVRLRMRLTFREVQRDGSHSALEAPGGNTGKVIRESQLATCSGSPWKNNVCSWGHCVASSITAQKTATGATTPLWAFQKF